MRRRFVHNYTAADFPRGNLNILKLSMRDVEREISSLTRIVMFLPAFNITDIKFEG